MDILNSIKSVLGLDPYAERLKTISEVASQLTRTQRIDLQDRFMQGLETVELRRSLHGRVSLVKTMLSLLPSSTNSVREWIRRQNGPYVAEVQFSIFCFLDQVPDLAEASDFVSEIPSLIEQYLLSVKTGTSQAAWMAGDLMGDHWNISDALPVLTNAARTARYAAGRKGALHGLAHALRRTNNSEQDFMLRLIRQISHTDKSQDVRKEALFLLEHYEHA